MPGSVEKHPCPGRSREKSPDYPAGPANPVSRPRGVWQKFRGALPPTPTLPRKGGGRKEAPLPWWERVRVRGFLPPSPLAGEGWGEGVLPPSPLVGEG